MSFKNKDQRFKTDNSLYTVIQANNVMSMDFEFRIRINIKRMVLR